MVRRVSMCRRRAPRARPSEAGSVGAWWHHRPVPFSSPSEIDTLAALDKALQPLGYRISQQVRVIDPVSRGCGRQLGPLIGTTAGFGPATGTTPSTPTSTSLFRKVWGASAPRTRCSLSSSTVPGLTRTQPSAGVTRGRTGSVKRRDCHWSALTTPGCTGERSSRSSSGYM